MTLNEATRRQIAAADPQVSTWLTANAGSGKTRVLTDRVARLLLEKVPPQNILCLTYTKAAASEMQNRLFERLGKWAMLDDVKLAREMEDLGVLTVASTKELAFARTLFARAIDTPGGLRIQTIHSFCASLLRRFPLEAGVSPLFREMDERAAGSLRQSVIEDMATGEQSALINNIARHYSGDDLTGLAAEACRHRDLAVAPKSDAEIWQQFELAKGVNEAQIIAQTFFGEEGELFGELHNLLKQSDKSTDHKSAEKLTPINFLDPTLTDLLRLMPILLYGAKVTKNQPFGAKTDAFPTKALRDANPDIIIKLNDFMNRVEQARMQYTRLLAAQKTKCFLQFSSSFLQLYEARKLMHGWLDFDDLITRARNLLSDPTVAQWVLFRLDGGLDHILVDEAQDTSPNQWKVIALLAQEFSAGIGARPDVQRTIFVVGDLKQSIYSFQGADPRAFEQMRQQFSSNLAASQQKLFDRSLEHSFRSSPAILTVVDAIFSGSGLSAAGGPASHLAFQNNLPGRVDLWQIVEKADAPAATEWFDPTDKIASNDHRVVLAEKIAAQIEALVKTGSITGKNGEFRDIQYGDFLILVQRRSELFHQIIRACKVLRLPIAGADRLKISAEMAVNDLQALLAFLALPQDSLSLAATLRSPLFGINETELFGLAHGREEKDLWPTLVKRKDEFQEAFAILSDLRNQVDFLRPYELLERILTRHGGRNKLLARLGSEADDGIDALLNQALTYESAQTPSLTGFLLWLDLDGFEIKRQSDNAGSRIRVMTTHGAKGLESPIVILPDTGDRRAPKQDEIILSPDGSLMWRTPATLRPSMMETAIERARQSQDEEAARLLYVALTRAEKWLIVCASGDVSNTGQSWYRQVETGMLAANAGPADMPTGQGLRFQHGQWPMAHGTKTHHDTPEPISLPGWAQETADAPGVQKKPLNPSDMPGEKTLAGEIQTDTFDDATIRGSKIHLLLEHLPEHQQSVWPGIARQLLPNMQENEIDGLIREVTAVINNPVLAHIFAENVLSEVNVTAPMPGSLGQNIRGTIDRLVVTPMRVSIIDFKSNRAIPADAGETPVGILRQMATYLLAIEAIYPDRDIELAIVWTHSASLMPLSHDIVRASLQSLPHLDVSQHDP